MAGTRDIGQWMEEVLSNRSFIEHFALAEGESGIDRAPHEGIQSTPFLERIR